MLWARALDPYRRATDESHDKTGAFKFGLPHQRWATGLRGFHIGRMKCISRTFRIQDQRRTETLICGELITIRHRELLQPEKILAFVRNPQAERIVEIHPERALRVPHAHDLRLRAIDRNTFLQHEILV